MAAASQRDLHISDAVRGTPVGTVVWVPTCAFALHRPLLPPPPPTVTAATNTAATAVASLPQPPLLPPLCSRCLIYSHCIIITGGLSEEQIQQMVRDAEAHAEKDR